jgi:DNA-binding MarR family transcriptional regulator
LLPTQPPFETDTDDRTGDDVANGHDLAMRLRVAYLALHRRTNAELARFGLTADQFVLLTALSEGDGVTQKELVRRTGSDPNSMSEMLSRLERKALVARERHAEDARARSVTLTKRGRQMQGTLWKGSATLRAELESLFSTDVLNSLVDGLDRIAPAMSLPVDQEGVTRRGTLRSAGAKRPKAGKH